MPQNFTLPELSPDDLTLYQNDKAPNNDVAGLWDYLNAHPEYKETGDYSGVTMTGPDGKLWELANVQSNNDVGSMIPTWKPAREQASPQPQYQPQPSYADPAPVGPTIYDSMDDWINIARREDYGRQNLPFVGPGTVPGRTGYQSISFDPAAALEQFYPGALNGWRDQMRDPFKGGLLKDIMPGTQQS